MKTKTLLAIGGGFIAGAAAGVAACTTEFGQKRVIAPIMAGKNWVENKFGKSEDDDEDDVVPEETTQQGEHVEED